MRKTIKAKVSDATNNSKKKILEKEWNKWKNLKKEVKKCRKEGYYDILDNKYQFFKTDEIHASYVSHAINQLKGQNEPLPLRNDCFNIQKRDTELVPFWGSIPTKERKRGVKIPLEVPYRYYDTLEDWEIKDSHLIKKDNEFWIKVTDQQYEKLFNGLADGDKAKLETLQEKRKARFKESSFELDIPIPLPEKEMFAADIWQEMTEKLIENGFAYEKNGNVYLI